MCACVIYVTSHAHNLFLINIDMYSNGCVCVNKHLTAFLSEYIVVYTVHMYNLCVQRGFRLVVGPDIFI